MRKEFKAKFCEALQRLAEGYAKEAVKLYEEDRAMEALEALGNVGFIVDLEKKVCGMTSSFCGNFDKIPCGIEE